MVGREVEVIPGYDLLFTWKGKKKLFDLLGVRTERQFAEKLAELQQKDELDNEYYAKMYCVGLNWKKAGTVITLEETEDIIEEFCQINGFGSEEVRDKLEDALCESGIFNKAVIMASRKMKNQIDEGKINTLLTKKMEKRGSDTGEPGQTSTSTT